MACATGSGAAMIVHPRRPSTGSGRRWLLAALIALLLTGLARPAQAQGNCIVITFDVCAYADQAASTYVQVPFMEKLWFGNRLLLLGARISEGLHDWLANEVLGTALDVVVAQMRFPFWIALAVASTVFVLTYLLQVVLVRTQLVHPQSALGVMALAIFIFQSSLPALASVEGLRMSFVAAFGSIGRAIPDQVVAPGLFLGDDGSVRAPQTIYGADVCPGIPTRRALPTIRMNDLTANYLWADTQDIHCPPADASTPDLPRAFMQGEGDFTGYLPVYPLSVADPVERARLVRRADDGTNRLLIGLFILTPAAVLESLWNLLMLVALANTGFALIVALPAGLFLPLSHLLREQLRGIVNVFQTSILSSLWIGLTLGGVQLAMRSGNGYAVGILGLIALVALGWQCVQAGLLVGRTIAAGLQSLGVSLGALGGSAGSVGQAAVNTGLIAAAAGTAGVGSVAGMLARQLVTGAGSSRAAKGAAHMLLADDRPSAGASRGNGGADGGGEAPWYTRRREAATPEATSAAPAANTSPNGSPPARPPSASSPGIAPARRRAAPAPTAATPSSSASTPRASAARSRFMPNKTSQEQAASQQAAAQQEATRHTPGGCTPAGRRPCGAPSGSSGDTCCPRAWPAVER
ncbi:MAG TPA: hypothetical protein VFS21_36465 [Roseiflexaceae bacterium]|nr:hypothetical protein [Roseiflexaceae bacterium]